MASDLTEYFQLQGKFIDINNADIKQNTRQLLLFAQFSYMNYKNCAEIALYRSLSVIDVVTLAY